jgi:hypothetical protein
MVREWKSEKKSVNFSKEFIESLSNIFFDV